MKFIIPFVLIFFFACNNNNDEVPTTIDVSHTEFFATASQWAVITDAYSKYLSFPSQEAEVTSYGRVGDIISIETIKIETSDSVWYKFENGWLSQASVVIYTNKLQALSASKKLLQK